MKTWVRKSLNVGVLSAGFLLVAGSAANANVTTANNGGLATGNQVGAVAQVPVTISGNATGILGVAQSSGGAGSSAAAASAGAGAMSTGANTGLANGNQLGLTAQAPIIACGNSVGILGFAGATCGGASGSSTGGTTSYGAGATSFGASGHHSASAAGLAGGALSTGGNGGLATGNQVGGALQVPVTVCGNAISLFGSSSASCAGGSTGFRRQRRLGLRHRRRYRRGQRRFGLRHRRGHRQRLRRRDLGRQRDGGWRAWRPA